MGMKWDPVDASSVFLTTSFTWKTPESSNYMYSYIFMLETYDITILPEVEQTHQNLWILLLPITELNSQFLENSVHFR